MQAPVETPGSSIEPEIAPLPEEVQAEAPIERIPFDTGKAVRYSVANFGASVMYGLFNFAMPLYLKTYNLEPWLIGLLANERSFVGAFVQPVVGRISDRTRTPLGRRRPFFLVGIPLTSLALILLAIHPEFWVMLGIMSVAAFFLAIAWDPYMAMLADLFPPLQRGRVGGFVGIGNGAGTLLFVGLAYMLWASNEFLVFLLVIGIMIVTWAYTFFTVKEPPIEEAAEPQNSVNVKPNPVQYVKDVMKYPEAAKYVLAILFFWLGTGGAFPFITLFGTEVLHATESEAFILPMGAIAATALFAVPAGYLADRIHSKKKVMLGGMAIYGLTAIIGSQSAVLWQGIAALAVIGVGNAALTLINPMLTDLVPKKRVAEFVGLGSAVFSLGQPLGSLLAGGVVTLSELWVGPSGAYRWAFIWAGTFVLISALLLLTVRPERFHDED